jgi:hypothetical protein
MGPHTREDVQGEIGDVLALCLHLSHRWGVSFHSALDGALRKVQARQEAGAWGEPDAAGVVEHKRETHPAQKPTDDREVVAIAKARAERAIMEERARQISLGWTPDHDDRQLLADWVELIAERADAAYSKGNVQKRIAQIAAVAQAALEAMIRRELREVKE